MYNGDFMSSLERRSLLTIGGNSLSLQSMIDFREVNELYYKKEIFGERAFNKLE